MVSLRLQNSSLHQSQARLLFQQTSKLVMTFGRTLVTTAWPRWLARIIHVAEPLTFATYHTLQRAVFATVRSTQRMNRPTKEPNNQTQTHPHTSKHAGRQASRHAGRQASMQARRLASTQAGNDINAHCHYYYYLDIDTDVDVDV